MSTNKRFLAKNGLDNNNNTIANVADPVNAQDVATKAFSSNASNLTSGTISGARMPTGGIANSALVNSAITIGGTSVSLGGTIADIISLTSLGVGTASPSAALQLGAAGSVGASAAKNMIFGDYSTAAQLRVSLNNTGNFIGIGTDGGTNMIFGTSSANAGTSPTTLMTLTSDGKLGIGRSPTHYKLEVADDIRIAVSAGGGIRDNNGNAFIYTFTSTGQTKILSTGASGYISLMTGNMGSTEAVRVDAAGMMAVGGTPQAGVPITVNTTSQNAVDLRTSNASGAFLSFANTSTSQANVIGHYKAASGGGTALNADALLLRSSNGIAFAPASGTASWQINTSSHLLPIADASYDVGATTTRVRAVYSGSYRFASTTQMITNGTGSPESVVTATVGSMYLRTDGGANTTLYIKESGTGNTGWVAK